jgi:hypothetical protein
MSCSKILKFWIRDALSRNFGGKKYKIRILGGSQRPYFGHGKRFAIWGREIFNEKVQNLKENLTNIN